MSNQLLYLELPARIRESNVYLNHDDDVKALLALFDRMHSEESYRVLANLGSYYLGEASGELYECLVLRKGRKMSPYLEHELDSSDCASQFGSAEPRVCMDLSEHIRNILRQLASGEQCPDSDQSLNLPNRSLPAKPKQ